MFSNLKEPIDINGFKSGAFSSMCDSHCFFSTPSSGTFPFLFLSIFPFLPYEYDWLCRMAFIILFICFVYLSECVYILVINEKCNLLMVLALFSD